MALLAPNLLINEGIFSIHGKDTGAGNCIKKSFVSVSDNNPNNSYNFGFYDKANNLVLKNDLSSSFGGKLEVAGGVIAFGGLKLGNGIPLMTSQGAGMGWNYTGGQGETNFFNNNANGAVAGGWTWIPTTNTVVGAPVMSLSQTGNLTLAGTISATNLTVSNGSWTPVLTSREYNVISQVYNVTAVGRYSISGKSVTLFYLISFDIYATAPIDIWIVLKGMPTICRAQALPGTVGGQSAPTGQVSWNNSNIAGKANPINFIIPVEGQGWSGNQYAESGPYFGLGDTYDGLGIYFYASYPSGLFGFTDQRMSGYVTYMLP